MPAKNTTRIQAPRIARAAAAPAFTIEQLYCYFADHPLEALGHLASSYSTAAGRSDDPALTAIARVLVALFTGKRRHLLPLLQKIERVTEDELGKIELEPRDRQLLKGIPPASRGRTAVMKRLRRQARECCALLAKENTAKTRWQVSQWMCMLATEDFPAKSGNPESTLARGLDPQTRHSESEFPTDNEILRATFRALGYAKPAIDKLLRWTTSPGKRGQPK